MKYVEPIKSFILLFLVLLSIFLTFVMWNYQPDYKQLIEEPQIENITVGEQKNIQSVLKPYRMLFRHNEKFTGTVSLEAINQMMSLLSDVQAEDLHIVNTNLPITKVNEMIRANERMTMFFKTEIPIRVFSNVLAFDVKELPEATFNRLIIDWSTVETTRKAQVLFASMGNETVYKTEITIKDKAKYKEIFLEQPPKYATYKEVERENLLSLYVAEEKQEVNQYTYLTDDISHEPFKEILFQDAGLVQKTVDNSSVEYTDWMSLLSFETDTKKMSYVNLVAERESLVPISRSDLVRETFDFINEHGGFTGDYRLTAVNLKKHVVDYQMYMQGLPVYSTSSTSTTARISTTWGENQILRYNRPHYALDNAIYESSVDVISGADIVKLLPNHSEIDYKKVDDIVLGYYLEYSMENTRLFNLQPYWFAISGNTWTRILPDGNGGDEYGLE